MQDHVLQSHKEALEACYREDYYTHIVDHFVNTMEVKTANDVCSFWNEVWNALPDSPMIRRSPFFLICDLAEGEYLEELS